MKKNSTLFLICGLIAFIGVICIAIGVALGGRLYGISFGGSGLVIDSQLNENEDNAKLQSGNETLESFEAMDISLEYADFALIPSDHYGIEYCLDKHFDFTYQVENNKLTVKQKSPKGSAASITFFSFGVTGDGLLSNEYVKIYIPKDCSLTDVSMKNNCGTIELGNFTCDKLTINDSYGDIKAEKIVCESLVATLNAGDFHFDTIMADSVAVTDDYGKLKGNSINGKSIGILMKSGDVKILNMTGDNASIASSYGNIDIDDADIKEKLSIDAKSGDVDFKSIKANEIVAHNSYGHICSEKTDINSVEIEMKSGDCELGEITTKNVNIQSSYGNVEYKLVGKCSDYAYDFTTKFGTVEIDGEDMGEACISLENEKENKMVVYCSSGDISIVQK